MTISSIDSQAGQKWHKDKEDLAVGTVVMKDQSPRALWQVVAVISQLSLEQTGK